MNRTRAVGVSIILLSLCGGSLFGQASKTGSPADHSAQLSSTNVQTRVEALHALGRLGTAARSESKAVERCIGDGVWDVQFAAVRALPEMLGPEDSAKVFTRIVQDAGKGKSRAAALVGLEKCGAFALPTIGWAINDKDSWVRYQAITTAPRVDPDGTLYDRILPMMAGEPEHVLHATRKYVLAEGIRRFYAKEGRWPRDFAEVHQFIRKGNALINLDPLVKKGEIKFTTEPDGSLKVGGYYTLPKHMRSAKE